MGGRSLGLEKRNHKICYIFQEDDGKKHAFNIVSRKLLCVFTESRVMCSTLVRSTWSFFFPTIPLATSFSEFPRVIFIRTGNRKVTDSAPRKEYSDFFPKSPSVHRKKKIS